MKRARARKTEEDDPMKSVERVLALSDADFDKWLERVITAGLATR
ncbi:MAG: hypothetical protein OK456_09460 [Thaumarchaeota archaeon]|nr:hypothetical protein [Nitrososphaerota archaeon]